MRTLVFLLPLLGACQASSDPVSPEAPWPLVHVRPTADFEVTGDGRNGAWSACEWIELHRRPGGELPYQARFKILYSSTGLYVLVDGTDAKLTTTGRDDFENLWEEDVYEAFFWPDESQPLYFEYEISPRNHELPILVPNTGGAFMGWRPWHYEGDRKTRKAVSLRAAPGAPPDRVEGWSAEFFIPYALLRGLRRVPPRSGMKWRANFYRMDYDGPKVTQWDWARVGPSFHEYAKYGVLVFD